MGIPNTLLGSALSPIVEKLISSMLKPSNIKARLNAIEAYTVCYPLYKVLSKDETFHMAEKLVMQMKEKPNLLYSASQLIGRTEINTIKMMGGNATETLEFCSLLYAPEVAIGEFAENKDLKSFLEGVEKKVRKRKFKEAFRVVSKRFKEKFEQSDVQIVGVEGFVKRVLTVVLALIELIKPSVVLSEEKLRITVTHYYSTLLTEIGIKQVLTLPITLASFIAPPEVLQKPLENIRMLQQTIPSPEGNPFIAHILAEAEKSLRFSYSDFKRTFQKIGELLAEPP